MGVLKSSTFTNIFLYNIYKITMHASGIKVLWIYKNCMYTVQKGL